MLRILDAKNQKVKFVLEDDATEPTRTQEIIDETDNGDTNSQYERPEQDSDPEHDQMPEVQ